MLVLDDNVLILINNVYILCVPSVWYEPDHMDLRGSHNDPPIL